MDRIWIAHCGATWVGAVGAVEWYAADSATTARVQVKRPEKFFFLAVTAMRLPNPLPRSAVTWKIFLSRRWTKLAFWGFDATQAPKTQDVNNEGPRMQAPPQLFNPGSCSHLSDVK